MLEGHEKDPGHLPGQGNLARLNVIVKLQYSTADAVLELEDVLELGPVAIFLRDF